MKRENAHLVFESAEIRFSTLRRQFRRWCRVAFGVLHGQSGQGTVEYAVVFVAFLSMIVCFGVLWHFFDVGTVVQHALQSASHHLQSVAPGAVGDVFQY